MQSYPGIDEVFEAVAENDPEKVVRACLKVAVNRGRRTRGTRVAEPKDLLYYLQSFAKKPVEYFGLVTLDGANQIIRVHVITKGIVNRIIMHPREVLRPAILDRAVALIVFHNHPSGNTEPSQEDREATNRLKQASALIGITMLDHLILSGPDVYSFREAGELS